jgi:hypothetical protein
MAKKTATKKVARNSGTGKFTTMKDAAKHPKTTEVEKVPVKSPKKKK